MAGTNISYGQVLVPCLGFMFSSFWDLIVLWMRNTCASHQSLLLLQRILRYKTECCTTLERIKCFKFRHCAGCANIVQRTFVYYNVFYCSDEKRNYKIKWQMASVNFTGPRLSDTFSQTKVFVDRKQWFFQCLWLNVVHVKVKVASSAHSLSRNLPNESGVCGLIKSMWRPMCPSALARLIELGRY